MSKAIVVFVVSISLIGAGLTAQAYKKDNILVYFPFDELKGGKTLEDKSGNGFDAELVGKGEIVNGKFGKALQLTGGHAQVLNKNIIESVGDTGQISIEHWIFLNQHAGWDGIVSIEAPEGDCCEFRTMVDPEFNPFWNMGHHQDKDLPAFTFKLKQWYHYVLTGDGKDGKVYVDGKLIGFQPENFKLPKFKTVTIYIGAGENPGVHKVEDGIIDEIVIYNVALSEKEINENMNKGIPGVLAVEPRDKLAVTWGRMKSRF
jgi:hypothetical protein